MRIVKFLVTGAAAVMAVGLAATPAMAQEAETDTTFEVLAGTLEVGAPTDADLLTGSPDGIITASLGTVTVSDGRASADASWLATVTSSNFVTGASTATQTILATEVDYWSGVASATEGTGTFAEEQTLVADREGLDVALPLTAYTHTGGTGNNTAAWAPTISVNVPLDSEAGIYTGTVTHSVA